MEELHQRSFPVAANTYSPSGMATAKRVDGATPNYAMQAAYPILYNYSTQIAYGDPVFLASDGTLRIVPNGGTSILGAFRGCKYLSPTTGKVEWYSYWSAPSGLASTTVVTAYVDSDPSMEFIMQGTGTAVTQSQIGLNVDIVTSSSGAPGTAPAGISTCGLLLSSISSTATLPFRIVAIQTAPYANTSYSSSNTNQYLRVMMNTQSNPAGTRTGQA